MKFIITYKDGSIKSFYADSIKYENNVAFLISYENRKGKTKCVINVDEVRSIEAKETNES